ncbi:MAG: hypothetical protein WC595_01650 [Candidatus Nanoarchaeia archaeon]
MNRKKSSFGKALALSAAIHLPFVGAFLTREKSASDPPVLEKHVSSFSIRTSTNYPEPFHNYTAAEVDQKITGIKAEDPDAFPDKEERTEDFLYAPQLPSKPKVVFTSTGAIDVGERYYPQVQSNDESKNHSQFDLPFIPESSNQRYPKEPTSLPELYRAKAKFDAQLLADMNDDPVGKVDLDKMSMLEFIVRSGYYIYAIDRLEDGKGVKVNTDKLYAAFEKIWNVAERRFKPEHSKLQRTAIFHAAMINALRGYEQNTRDIVSALEYGVINCDSVTRVAVAGYERIDPETELNVTLDHIQAAIKPNGENVIIENTDPVRVFHTHKRGFLVKPEAYVVGYLTKQADASLSDFPEEIREWYNYPVPNFLGISQPFTGLPLVGELSGIKKPGPGFKPFVNHPSFFPKTNILGPNDAINLADGSGIATEVTGLEDSVEIASKYRTAEEILRERVVAINGFMGLIKEPELREDVKTRVKGNINVLDMTLLKGERYRNFREVKSEYEREGIFDEVEVEKSGSHKKKNVLLREVRDGTGLGLVGDNLSKTETFNVSYVSIPRKNWCEVGADLLNRKVEVYGNRLEEQVRGLYVRAQAIRRAEVFSGRECNLDPEKRVELLERVMRGKRARGFSAEFRKHANYKLDPLISLEKMEASTGTSGISLAAIEDVISFAGEGEAVEAVIGYLKRDDVNLERLMYGRILVSTENRLLDEREGFLSKAKKLIGRNGELDAAVVQLLHNQGEKGGLISEVLERYVLFHPDLTAREVLNFTKTGLDTERAKEIMRVRFREYLELLEKGLPASTTRSELKRTRKIMVEAYETLGALSDEVGFKEMKKSFDRSFEGKEYWRRQARISSEEIAHLLIRHDKHVPEIVEKYRGLVDVTVSGGDNDVSSLAVELQFPIITRVLEENGYGKVAVELFEKILNGKERMDGRARLFAAAALEGFGEKKKAREGLIAMIEEPDPTLSWEYIAKVVEGSSESSDQTRRLHQDPLPIFYELARIGVSPSEQARIQSAVKNSGFYWREHIEEIAERVSVEYSLKSGGTDDERLLARGIARGIVREEARSGFVEQGRKYVEAIEQLGLMPTLPEFPNGYLGKRGSMADLLPDQNHPIVEQYVNLIRGSESLINDPLFTLFYQYHKDYSPFHLGVITRCLEQEIEGERALSTSFGVQVYHTGDACTRLLVTKGYLDVNERDEVVFHNPPKEN